MGLDHPIATRPGVERGVEGRALPEELTALLVDVRVTGFEP